MLDLGVLRFYFKAWGLSNQHLRIEYLIFNLKVYFFYKWHICILLGMYIVAFFIGFLFWKSCKFWRRLRALDYIWKSGVGFTLFLFTNLFVEILGRKGSGTMIFIVSWCYGGLAMVMFILFWQGSYPPWWHHWGIGKLSSAWQPRCLETWEKHEKAGSAAVPVGFWTLIKTKVSLLSEWQRSFPKAWSVWTST